ncbi:hypothetical protein O59_002506 [Cellvibrio sp. BR]|nr:hypothetical protein O59_002506 [Cellvibrio sp. BR]
MRINDMVDLFTRFFRCCLILNQFTYFTERESEIPALFDKSQLP